MNPRPLPYQGSALPLSYSGHKKRAGDGARIRDPQLGRLMLYQLSYSRLYCPKELQPFPRFGCRNFLFYVGRAGFEPTKAFASRFTVCPSWPLWYLPNKNRVILLRYTFTTLSRADEGIRTPDLQITNQLLWPTELHRQFKERTRRA